MDYEGVCVFQTKVDSKSKFWSMFDDDDSDDDDDDDDNGEKVDEQFSPFKLDIFSNCLP